MASCVVASVTVSIRSRLAELAYLAAALPTGPVIFVNLHQPFRQLDGLRLTPYLDHRVSADQLLGFGEWAVHSLDRAVDQRHDGARGARQQAALVDQRAVSGTLAAYSPIAWNSSGGGGPTGRDSSNFSSAMYRMTFPLSSWPGFIPGLHLRVARLLAISTWPVEISPNKFHHSCCRERRALVDAEVKQPLERNVLIMTTTTSRRTTDLTRTLLGAGVVAGPLFVGIVAVQRSPAPDLISAASRSACCRWVSTAGFR